MLQSKQETLQEINEVCSIFTVDQVWLFLMYRWGAHLNTMVDVYFKIYHANVRCNLRERPVGSFGS